VHADVTVFVNREEHARIFRDAGLDVSIVEEFLLRPGSLPRQYFDGWRRRTAIRALVVGFDHVIVSAGAVEAGVAVGVALRGFLPTTMYLPSFYDRVPVWGWTGHIYNCVLGTSCKLFDRIITINRIQAFVIRAFSGVPTLVVTNQIRRVQPPVEQGASRLVFVGRMDQQKRVAELMTWLDTVSNPIKDMILIGEGPMRVSLEALAENLKNINCKFLGWMSPDDQDKLIRASDILILNSLIEGEPLVLREARLRGMRILAREIVGTRGLTSRVERFNAQHELIDKLINISNNDFSHTSIHKVGSLCQDNIKRMQGVLALLRSIT
jgi:glycosyltransferase involved in cell wall biosynthesis